MRWSHLRLSAVFSNLSKNPLIGMICSILKICAMKRIFVIISALAVLSACNRAEEVTTSYLELRGVACHDTRTQFGQPNQQNIPFLWSAGDYIQLGSVKSNPIEKDCLSATFRWDNPPSTIDGYHLFYNMTARANSAKILATQSADGNLGNDGDFGYALADEFGVFVLEHKCSYIWFDTTAADALPNLLSITVSAETGIYLAGEQVFDYKSDCWQGAVTNGASAITLNFGQDGVALKAVNDGVFAAAVTLPAAIAGTEITVEYAFADGRSFKEVKTPKRDLTVGSTQRIATTIKAVDLTAALDYDLRVLTFEDCDAEFEAYMLDYYANSINVWSDLIDPLQYGGDLLYYQSGGTYTWNDSGNTNLTHAFAVPYWTGGHALSNYTIADYSKTPEGYYGWYELQLAIPIAGHNGSDNFCVHNGYRDDFNAEIYDAQLQGFAFADGVERVIDHMYVTNTCYVLNSLLYGDGFAPPATDESLFKIVAYGYDAADNQTASTELVLCKGTEAITEWVKFDLSVLGKVAKVVFNFAPSDDLVGIYGMNTPAYFAYDDVAVRFEL